MKDSAIYIHIPFCDHKCIYCDFYSIITSDNIYPFLESIKKEIAYYSHLNSNERHFSSIYFGGGTPSLMEPEFLEEIIKCIKRNFNVDADAEITMETNPGTIDRNKLISFRRIGINRLSIGIQSFNDDELKFLTRIHDKQIAVDTIHNAKEAGFENISIDLIFNLPGQTKEKWLSNLETAIQLPIKHLSAYSLILERGTILNKMVLDKKVDLQDNDYDADLYESTINFCESNGFFQYEVSNFSKPGYECRHNNAYWRYRDYLSFGPSAHSFIGKKRWWNYSSLKRYIFEIDNHYTAEAGYEFLNEDQIFNEYVMLALRSFGIDLNDFKIKFGDKWIKEKKDYFEKLVNNHLVEMNDKSIKLTKHGYAVCDEILGNIL